MTSDRFLRVIYTKRSKIVKIEHARYTLERLPTDFCALSIQKRSKIVKNEHARYTLERLPTDLCALSIQKDLKSSKMNVRVIR
jgi:hypothetical protein